MQIRDYRPYGVFVSFLLLLAVLSFLPGCDQPVTYGHPQMALLSNPDGATDHVYATVQSISYGGENPEFVLLVSKTAGRDDWQELARYRSRVAGIENSDGKLRIIYEDGAIWDRDAEKGELTKFIQGAAGMKLLCAKEINGKIYAVLRENKDSGLKLMMLDGEKWKDMGPAQPTVGRPVLVSLVGFKDCPTLFWREEVGGRREHGIKIVTFKNGSWITPGLPPADDSRSFYAVTNVDGSLFYLRETYIEPHEERTRLELSRFDGESWNEITSGVPIPSDHYNHQALGLSLIVDGSGMLILRASTAGLHAYVCQDHSGGAWRMTAPALAAGQGEEWALMFLLLAFALGFFLIVTTRVVVRKGLQLRMAAAARARANGSPANGDGVNGISEQELATFREFARPLGAPASIIDRALAMMVDAIIISPFLAVYMIYSHDYEPFNLPVEESAFIYWIWLCSIVLYSWIAEAAFGATIGKMIFGIRVRNAAGGKPSAMQCFLRNIARFIDFIPVALGNFSLFYLVALLAVSVTRRRQRVGDIFAQTVVLRHTPLERRNIVLASSSPRRRDLMDMLGLPFRVCNPDVDETMIDSRPPEEEALRVAQKKAEAAARAMKGGEIVIAADTIVVLDGKIIGKPENREHAREILSSLSGRAHNVLTAVAIIDRATGQSVSAIDGTEVIMREMSADDIEEYVESGEADGKAGAYAIQETADRFVADVHGSLSNVIGLPMELLQRMLEEIDA
ncbi:MAG: septum formation protein Maf [Planctomycetes bacterium]|nr:septum formation protein Maf [Planctomycetota bacterium]